MIILIGLYYPGWYLVKRSTSQKVFQFKRSPSQKGYKSKGPQSKGPQVKRSTSQKVPKSKGLQVKGPQSKLTKGLQKSNDRDEIGSKLETNTTILWFTRHLIGRHLL